jgi:hypothetical protein
MAPDSNGDFFINSAIPEIHSKSSRPGLLGFQLGDSPEPGAPIRALPPGKGLLNLVPRQALVFHSVLHDPDGHRDVPWAFTFTNIRLHGASPATFHRG